MLMMMMGSLVGVFSFGAASCDLLHAVGSSRCKDAMRLTNERTDEQVIDWQGY